MSFATVEELGDYLGGMPSDREAAAELALASATSVIQDYVGQTLTYVEDDEITLDGSNTDVLVLPELPVTEVASVEIDGEELGEDDYEVDFENGLLVLDAGTWGVAKQSIAVIYTHGYEEIPSGIRAICLQAAGRMFAQAGIAQEQIGATSIRYGAVGVSLTPEEKQTLDRYRFRRLA